MSTSSLSLINTEQFKHLLTPAINHLSHKIQNTSFELAHLPTTNKRYLNIENEALEYIGSLILNVFNSILVGNYNFLTPESTCSIAMSCSNNASDSPTFEASIPSQVGSITKICNNSSEITCKPCVPPKIDPISDLAEAEMRVRHNMPHSYIEAACYKASQYVEKSQSFMNNSRRNKLLKAINDIQNNFTSQVSSTSSSIYTSSTNPELAQHFTFPIDRIHAILSKEIFFQKLDLFVTIYLVNILEYICKDILRLTLYYVRMLGKYNINKSDVTTAIQADPMLPLVVFGDLSSSNFSSTNEEAHFGLDNFEFNNPDDDVEDELLLGNNSEFLGSSLEKTKSLTRNLNNLDFKQTFQSQQPLIFNSNDLRTCNSSAVNTKLNNLKRDVIVSNTTYGSNSSNNEDVTSDSSTICAESVSQEQLNQKYQAKVRELVAEQKQYLYDLNVLRRVFMFLFKRCCYLYSIRLDESVGAEKEIESSSNEQVISNIFGNINDLYDCALRLSDLLEDATILNNNNTSLSVSSSLCDLTTTSGSCRIGGGTGLGSSSQLMVGQQFWELAEGDEFSIYTKYAETVTNFSQVKASIMCILANPSAQKILQQASPGLTEISKYLLPKLLMSSVYHFLYLTETIDYLQQVATDEEDKNLLVDTLDTLKRTKYKLAELNFTHSRFRPIETSFRMFHTHQYIQEPDNRQASTAMSDLSCVSLNNLSQKNTYYLLNVNSNTNQALVSNVFALTQRKLTELETKVESFKLPPNMSLTGGDPSNIRNPYLYEGSLSICRTTQPIQCGTTKIGAYINSQPKFKISKRHVYLFDGFLVLVKRTPTNYLTSSKFASRFKQIILLDKCVLKDHDDDTSFEIQVCGSGSFNFFTEQLQTIGSGQDTQDFIIFTCENSKDKWEWMSMLCYAQISQCYATNNKFTIDRLLQQMTEEQNSQYTLPIPPDNYIFDQPDSSETIIFDQAYKPTTSSYITAEGLSIRAATLIKLVERLTHHRYHDPKLRHTFLMCYREFCTSTEFFNLLVQRYDVPDLTLSQKVLEKYANGGIIERELFKRYKCEYQQPIRQNVVNIFRHWLCKYFSDDFGNDAELLSRLQEFIQRIGDTSQSYQRILLKILNKRLTQERDKSLKEQDIISANESKMDSTSLNSNSSINSDKNFLKPSSTNLFANSSFATKSTSSRSSSVSTTDDSSTTSSKPSKNSFNESLELTDTSYLHNDFPPFLTHLEAHYPYDILTIHPLEFARQATLMESELFKAIKPSELISLGWTKPDQRHKLSPNLTKLIDLSNKFTYWYAKCIVDTLNIDERVAVVLRILDIAEYFDEMNNFSGLKEIYAAFDSASVTRLEVTRERSGLEQHRMYAKFKELFDNHQRGYLERIKKCDPPCVPFIGIHQTFVLKTQEYNKLNDENHKIKIIAQQQLLKAEECLANDVNNNNNNSVCVIPESVKSEASSQLNPAAFCLLAKTHLINFSKYRLLVEFVTDLLQFQNISYKVKIHEKIRAFILEDIDNYFKNAELAMEAREAEQSDSKINFSETKLCSAEMISSWLYVRSKQIEPKDVFNYPRIKTYPLKAPAPVDTSRLNSRNNYSQQNAKISSKAKLVKRPSQQFPVSPLNLSMPQSVQNQIEVSQLSPIDKLSISSNSSRSIFQKRPILRLPDQTPFSSTSPSSSPSPSPTYHKNVERKYNLGQSNFSSNNNPVLMSSSSSVGNICNPGLSLASSSASTISSSQMFPYPASSSILNHSIAPFGSYSTPATSQEQQEKIQRKTSETFSIGHGRVKLSLSSSADSSSSAPNSPPPNYDEVFDSSSATGSFNFVSSGSVLNNINNTFDNNSTINQPTVASISYSGSANIQLESEKNCYDNKTYFQRLDSQTDVTQNTINIHQGVKLQKSHQHSVFSFPDFTEQNEETQMVSRTNSTDFLSSSSSMQSSPLLLPQENFHITKKTVQHSFNMLTAPPACRPPPPPREPPAIPTLPPHLQAKYMGLNSESSLNNQSAQLNPSQTGERFERFPRQPPPIPARPGASK